MWDSTYTETATFPQDRKAVTTANGTFSVDLEAGLPTAWQCVLPDGEAFNFVLEPGAPVTIEYLRAIDGFPVPITPAAQIAIEAAIAPLEAEIDTKADAATVTSALALKANTADVNAALATKATPADITAAVTPVADDVAALETTVAGKADTATVNAALALKADQTDVQTLNDELDTVVVDLGTKADQSALDTTNDAVALKANTADVNAALALKASQADLDTAEVGIATLQFSKADAAATQTALNTKATIASVDALSDVVDTKAAQADLDAAEATIADVGADLSGLTAEVATKAPITAVEAVETTVARVAPPDAGPIGYHPTIGPEGPAWTRELVFDVTHPRFGAVGDGLTDDTDAIQLCIDTVPEGSTIILPLQHAVTEVVLNKKHITIQGPGGLHNGGLVVGQNTTAREDLFFTIQGVQFTYDSYDPSVDTTSGIRLLRARRGTIRDCFFQNIDKAIHVASDAGAVSHDTAIIKMFNNEFSYVGTAWYVDRDNAANVFHTSDCKFIANTINLALKYHIWIKSIDGVVITDNVMFFTSYTSSDTALKALKSQNIYVGESDWVNIRGNQLFESGLESIYLDKPKHYVIANNNTAWSGQRDLTSAIKIAGSSQSRGTITGNVLGRFSRHGVEITNTGGGVHTITGNVIEFSITETSYYGSSALSSISHFPVYQDPSSSAVVYGNLNELLGDLTYSSIKSALRDGVRLGFNSGVATTYKAVSVTAANTQVFSLTAVRGATTTHGGLIWIDARGSTSNNATFATYLLMVTKTTAGVHITEIQKQGLTAGAGAGHPSFTWTLSASGNLEASPVALTTGTFHFYATHVGNLVAS